MSTNFGRKNGKHRDWMRDIEAETSAGGEEDALWQLLSVYADGEATPEEAAQVEAHLRANPAVARDLDFLRLASAGVQSFPEMEPPAALRDSIFAATVRRQSLRSRLAVGWSDLRRALMSEPARYAVPVGGALALAGVAALFFHPHGGTPKLNGPDLAMNSQPKISVPMDKPNVNKPHATLRTRKSTPAPVLMPKTEPMFVENNAKPVEQPRKSTDHKVLSPELHIAEAATAGAKRSPALRMAKNTTKPKFAHLPAQRPSKIDSDETMQVAYSPHPMMDVPNLHATSADDTDTPEGGIGGADVVATEAIKTAGAATASATPANDTEPKMIVHRAPLILAQLPPDSRHIVTGADIKRIREASRLGYNQETVESIERRQATVAFVSRF